ncbi:hypothetical protein IGI04_004576 [Brassica rapa subsp. trilocularis]|uniref:peptide-methionine (S)-S-oxide reductase n=1 Tax=Brassica rapa subsp. trilocularis TaxID=1813537 RepID=A0ABQ7NBI8_BRACM|nr:hypothetical protein IGI04_004576 [Brassica rapa subsp. trilocularis]
MLHLSRVISSQNPSYKDVCINTTNHAEVVRVHYDPNECTYETLLDLFWSRHDPTTLNRIYFYTPEQEKLARESLETQQKTLEKKIVTEILPAKKFYKAQEYHQHYLSKGLHVTLFEIRVGRRKGCKGIEEHFKLSGRMMPQPAVATIISYEKLES